MTKYKIGDRVKVNDDYQYDSARSRTGTLIHHYGTTISWRVLLDGESEANWSLINENKFELVPEKEPELPQDIIEFLTLLRQNLDATDLHRWVREEGAILAHKYLPAPHWWPGDAVVCSHRLYIRDMNGFWKGNNQPWPGHYTDEAVDAWENKKIIAQKGIVL